MEHHDGLSGDIRVPDANHGVLSSGNDDVVGGRVVKGQGPVGDPEVGLAFLFKVPHEERRIAVSTTGQDASQASTVLDL